MLKPQGIITALVTPFRESDEKIDYTALKNIIDIQCEAGVHGIFISGSTAEAYAMEPEEKRELLQATKEYAAGRTQVFFGAGGNSTRQTIDLVQIAEKEGADAVSVITTYFATPSQDELYGFYSDIAKSTSLPIIMYNHPLRTMVNISGSTIGKLSKINNIVGVKDSSGNMNNSMDFIANTERDFGVLSGNDSLILSLLDLGGSGAVSASANFVPKLLVDMYKEYTSGNREKAFELQMKLFAVRKLFNLGTYPAMIKDACRVMGIDMGICRRPVTGLSESDLCKLTETLKEAGQI